MGRFEASIGVAELKYGEDPGEICLTKEEAPVPRRPEEDGRNTRPEREIMQKDFRGG